MNPPERRAVIGTAALALVAVTILAYWPVLGAGFLNYDDPSYVTANPQVGAGLSLEGIGWALRTFHFYNWLPLTWLSHMLDVQLFGMNPAGHHAVSLLLHVANGLLLFALLGKTTGSLWRSACVAGLFALHPLHVESVAWVSERKDVLSTFFGLLALLVYVQYAETRKTGRYLLCLFLFALGLTAKPMLISLPLVLLLLDYWPLGRFDPWRPHRGAKARVLLAEKIPFLLFSVASAAITFAAQQRGGAVKAQGVLPENAANALVSYVGYVQKMFWPSGLSVFYPYRAGDVSIGEGLLALAALTAATWAALRLGRRRPHLPVGWLWYLGTLVPVIGFVKIGDHAMADRYTYLPLVGLFLIVVWEAAYAARRFAASRKVTAGAALAILFLCAGLTHAQATRWQNSEALFRHALAVTNGNWVAHKNLAAVLAQQGKLDEALFHVSESLRLWPEPLEYVSQGWLYLQLGQYANAAEAARKSLALASEGNEKAYFILGLSSGYLGDSNSVAAAYEALRRISSRYAQQLENFLSSGVASPRP